MGKKDAPKEKRDDPYAALAKGVPPASVDRPDVPDPKTTADSPDDVAKYMTERAEQLKATLEAKEAAERAVEETVDPPLHGPPAPAVDVIEQDDPALADETPLEPRPRYRGDADPTDVNALEVMERLTDGRLIVPAAWHAIAPCLYRLIDEFKKRVCA